MNFDEDRKIRHHSLFGDHSEEATPVPIPNTAVKLLSGDGTTGFIPWESSTSPKLFDPGRVVFDYPACFFFFGGGVLAG